MVKRQVQEGTGNRGLKNKRKIKAKDEYNYEWCQENEHSHQNVETKAVF